MDLAHDQKFWNDPAGMKGQDENWVNRIKYMTDQFLKTASSVNAELLYLKDEIKPENLSDCDLLFIHTVFNPPLTFNSFVMEEDYWTSLEDANVNDLIKPFDIQFGEQSSDTTLGGITKAGIITEKSLKISYYYGRVITGGTPFCFSKQNEKYKFGVYKKLNSGGKLIVMGDGMVSLYMTSWEDINDFQCTEFMHDTFKWLLSNK